MTRSHRLAALMRTAAEAPTIPTSLDKLDPATRERLDAFAASQRINPAAALVLVRDAQKAARTQLRADARVEEAVSTAVQRRRLGLVGIVSLDPELDASTDAAVAEVLDRRNAERSVTRG